MSRPIVSKKPVISSRKFVSSGPKISFTHSTGKLVVKSKLIVEDDDEMSADFVDLVVTENITLISLLRSELEVSISNGLFIRDAILNKNLLDITQGAQGLIKVSNKVVSKICSKEELEICKLLKSKIEERRMDWSNLVEIVGVTDNEVLMPYSGITLEEFLNTTVLDFEDHHLIDTIITQVVSAISKLHSLGFQHRDIAPRNIFLTIEDDLKISVGDYGCIIRNDWAMKINTPESNPDKVSTYKTDSYQIGLILKRLIYLSINPLISQDIRQHGRFQLMEKLLSDDQDSRPTPRQVKTYMKYELSIILLIKCLINKRINCQSEERRLIDDTIIDLRKGVSIRDIENYYRGLLISDQMQKFDVKLLINQINKYFLKKF